MQVLDEVVGVQTVEALSGLKKCVQANSAGKGYLNGWGATDTGASSSAAVSAAIAKTDAALAAAGVPGITSSTGVSSSGSSDNDACGNPVPWTGILCSGDRVTQVYASALTSIPLGLVYVIKLETGLGGHSCFQPSRAFEPLPPIKGAAYRLDLSIRPASLSEYCLLLVVVQPGIHCCLPRLP